MSENYLTELETLLSKNAEYIVEDKLNKNKIAELAHKYDTNLIDLLASSKAMQKLFFIETKSDVLVFNKDKFIQFISNKEWLPNSYTTYKNKIGLGTGIDLLSEQKDVVLNWPYKDCVLEGGQDKEDAKRDELFHNEVLAPDQIDRLLDEKVLTGFKRYDKDGSHDVKEIADDDNLIIRGNNLLALYSIKKRYAGKIKLIYIDPPYNTGSDSFGYNDSFNHTAWLTFIRNRLQIAKQLLAEDGLIFVHCDNNEQAYLKLIMDEIFGRENFLETITVVNNPRGRDYGALANMHEFIHVFSKSFNYKTFKLVDENKEFPFEDKDGGFEIRELRNRNTAFNSTNRRNLFYPFWLNPKKKDKDGFYEIGLDEVPGWIKVEPAKSQGIQTVWRWGKEKASKNLNSNIVGKDNKNGGYQITEKYREKSRLARSVWWDKEVNSERGSLHVKQLFDNTKVFSFPKPEELISRILQISTEAGDFVLDFFIGSGTTASVSHKMGRHYIGIEQMNYTETVTVERMKKVIDGEQGGVSKINSWSGGGDFVYCLLMDLGNKFIEKVKHASTDRELTGLLEQAQKSSFLSYRVDPEKINPGDKDFTSLSVAHKKQLLLEIVDRNHLYVNYTEIDDADYGVSSEDKKLNKQFYSN